MSPVTGSAPRTYTLEEKIALVTRIDELLRTGVTKAAAAEAAGTSWTSYLNWTRAGIRPARTPVARSRDEWAGLVAAVQARVAEGLTIKAACLEVGISEDRFYQWRKRLAPAPPMRPVEVADVKALVPVSPAALTLAPPRPVAQAVQEGLVLVAPGGYRIEGLAVETAAALLRALA